MARSAYIYIAYNHADELLGAWTVKHELVTHAKNARKGHRDYQIWKVIRTRDGTGAGELSHQVDDISEAIGAAMEKV